MKLKKSKSLYEHNKGNKSLEEIFAEREKYQQTRWCNKCGCEQPIRESKCRIFCKVCGEWLR